MLAVKAIPISGLGLPIVFGLAISSLGTMMARNREFNLIHQRLLDRFNQLKNRRLTVYGEQQKKLHVFSGKKFMKWLFRVTMYSLIMMIPVLVFALKSLLISEPECTVVDGIPRGQDFTRCAMVIQILQLVGSAIAAITFVFPCVVYLLLLVIRKNSPVFTIIRYLMFVSMIIGAGIWLVHPVIIFAVHGELSYDGWEVPVSFLSMVALVGSAALILRRRLSLRVSWRLCLPSLLLVVSVLIYTLLVLKWFVSSSPSGQAAIVLFLHPFIHKCGEFLIVQVGQNIFMDEHTHGKTTHHAQQKL